MNKEIEDKVKELSRRIVGTGQIVVTAESLTGGMISAALTSILAPASGLKEVL